MAFAYFASRPWDAALATSASWSASCDASRLAAAESTVEPRPRRLEAGRRRQGVHEPLVALSHRRRHVERRLGRPDVRHGRQLGLDRTGLPDDVDEQLVPGRERIVHGLGVTRDDRRERASGLRAEVVDRVRERAEVRLRPVECRRDLGVAAVFEAGLFRPARARVRGRDEAGRPEGDGTDRDEPRDGREGRAKATTHAGVAPMRASPRGSWSAGRRRRYRSPPSRSRGSNPKRSRMSVERPDVVEAELAQLVGGDGERQVDDLGRAGDERDERDGHRDDGPLGAEGREDRGGDLAIGPVAAVRPARRPGRPSSDRRRRGRSPGHTSPTWTGWNRLMPRPGTGTNTGSCGRGRRGR